MAGLLGRANLWYCRQCRPGTSALTITGPTAFANGVNLELLRLVENGDDLCLVDMLLRFGEHELSSFILAQLMKNPVPSLPKQVFEIGNRAPDSTGSVG